MRTLCTLPKTSPCTLCPPRALRASAPHTRSTFKVTNLFPFANDLLLFIDYNLLVTLLVFGRWARVEKSEYDGVHVTKTRSITFSLSFVLHHGSLLSLRSFGFILGHRREVEYGSWEGGIVWLQVSQPFCWQLLLWYFLFACIFSAFGFGIDLAFSWELTGVRSVVFSVCDGLAKATCLHSAGPVFLRFWLCHLILFCLFFSACPLGHFFHFFHFYWLSIGPTWYLIYMLICVITY